MPFQLKLVIERQQEARKLYSELQNGHLVAERMEFGHTTVYKYLNLQSRHAPTWSDDELQVLVDGYYDKKPVKEIAKMLTKRSPRAVMVRMCRYRKSVKEDPKKKRALRAISFALRAVKKADIFKEMEA